MIPCLHPGCTATFPKPQGRGRPAVYCPEHRKTKYAMERKRKYPWLKTSRLSKCCLDASAKKCPQHRSADKAYMAYARRRDEPDDHRVIADLLAVFGHVNILSARGWRLRRVEAEGGE